MAVMIFLVSASGDSPVSPSTGRPDADRDGRRVAEGEHVGQPLAARPHLLGAPQPDRDDRRTGHGRQARRAPATLQHGVEEGRPRGIVPCGIIATSSPASSARAAAASGSSDPVPRSTRMPPIAVAS